MSFETKVGIALDVMMVIILIMCITIAKLIDDVEKLKKNKHDTT
jgi:hypothetical protein